MTAIYKSEREASEETNPGDILILISYFELQNFEKLNFCCSSHLALVCDTLLW